MPFVQNDFKNLAQCWFHSFIHSSMNPYESLPEHQHNVFKDKTFCFFLKLDTLLIKKRFLACV